MVIFFFPVPVSSSSSSSVFPADIPSSEGSSASLSPCLLLGPILALFRSSVTVLHLASAGIARRLFCLDLFPPSVVVLVMRIVFFEGCSFPVAPTSILVGCSAYVVFSAA